MNLDLTFASELISIQNCAGHTYIVQQDIISGGVTKKNKNNLGLSCAKLRPASLLRFLLLENFEFCKCAKLELGLGLSLAKSCLQVVNKS